MQPLSVVVELQPTIEAESWRATVVRAAGKVYRHTTSPSGGGNMSSGGKPWAAQVGASASIQYRGPLGLLETRDIGTILTCSKYPQVICCILHA
jgi:hypothetical protein